MNRLSLIRLCLLLLIFSGCVAAPRPMSISVEQRANPWTQLRLNNDPDRFQFAIICDRTGGNRPGVFEDAIRKLNLLQPEFVMSVGDLIQGYSKDEAEIERQWDEFEGLVQELEMPFFYVPGNHDITNERMARIWRERFGRSYYHFIYRGVLFLCLNTEDPPPSHLSPEQIEYVARVLRENRAALWTVVFMHKPLWLQDKDTGWERVEALLSGRPHTVFAGHAHSYCLYERQGQRYFVLATTGGASGLRGPLFGQFDHIVWITMTEQGPVVAPLLLDGILDENVRSEKVAAAVDPLIWQTAITATPIITEHPLLEETTTEVCLTNKAEVPMTVRGSFQPHPQLTAIPVDFERVVPPHSVERLDLTLQAAAAVNVKEMDPLVMNWAAAYDFPNHPRIEMEGTHRVAFDTLFQCPYREEPVVVDGRLGEWSLLPMVCREPALIQFEPKSWQGPEDCSFRFGVAYDKDFLYVAIETVDEHRVSLPNEFPWHQDGIEVRLDARPAPARSEERGQGELEDFLLIALSPTQLGEPPQCYRQAELPEGVQAACVGTENGHTTEIAVPRAYLDEKQGEPWTTFRMNIAIDDYDVNEPAGAQIWWRPDWRSPSNFAHSGTFERQSRWPHSNGDPGPNQTSPLSVLPPTIANAVRDTTP